VAGGGPGVAVRLFVLWREGTQSALEYYTGYLIELSLSVDNLFVSCSSSPISASGPTPSRRFSSGDSRRHGHAMIMIGLGAFLFQRFSWIVYVFGAILG